MRQYERLLEDQRNSRRTIADAIEALCENAHFGEGDLANIRIGGLKLPSGGIVYLVAVVFDAPSREKAYIVSLPTSDRCRALSQGSPERQEIDIPLLDDAAVDFSGRVRLTSGQTLHAADFVSAHLPLDPPELEWRILHHVIALTKSEERGYREWGEGFLRGDSVDPTDLRVVDCSTLPGLPVPPLKVIAGYVAENDWTLRKLSQQKIADALITFGVRRPVPRRRVARAS